MKIPIGIIKAIDRALYLKNEIKLMEDEKKQLTDTIKDYMKRNRLTKIEGKEAQAEYSTREPSVIHPEEYFEALDGDVDKLLASVTVRINQSGDRKGAKSFLGEEDLEAISDFEEVPVLKLSRLKETVQKVPEPTIAKPRIRKILNTTT